MATATAATAGPGPRLRPRRRSPEACTWSGLVVLLVARAYRAFVLTLVAIALVPAAWGWAAHLVRTGSMEPGITAGDVVVAAPFGPDADVPAGRVMVFTNPAHPGSDRTLVHRVVGADERTGTYTTAGDANREDDTTPVPRDHFRARAVLLVPFIGRPFVWAEHGDVAPLVAWGMATAAAFMGAGLPRRRRHQASASTPPTSTIPEIPPPAGTPDAATPRSRWRAGLHTVAGLVVLVGAVTTARSAEATFTAQTRNSGSTWAVGSLAPAYVNAVLADAPYAYYRLDETGGTAVTDRSGAGRTGTATNVTGYLQPDALPNNPGSAIALSAVPAGRVVVGGPALVNPTTYSLEVWFKTTSLTGGKVMGFENGQGTTSSTYDRHVFIRPNGQLVYGGWSNPNDSPITTPSGYNDGAWHHLVLTATAHGALQNSVLYVDGVPVASGTTTKTSSYSGWWRFGSGRLPTGVGYPLTTAMAVSLDEAAVYPTALSPARVAAHYAAR